MQQQDRRMAGLWLAGVVWLVALGIAAVIALRLSVLAGALAGVFVLTMGGVGGVVVVIGQRSGEDRDGARRTDLETRVSQLHETVKGMAQQATLSDDARRVLNRAREREVLCGQIEQDITTGNYDGALVLIEELAERFGYRADAETFRTRIDQLRRATIEAEVTGAIAGLDGVLAERRWDDAYSEAARIQRLYPSSARVERLHDRVTQALDSFKKELERSFLVAAQAGDVEQSLEWLRQLDAYLTPAEAEPLREVARGVIGKARDNLGASFKIAVQDRRWRDASALGEQIIAQFPNSRMAAEVRDVIDGVRARAGG